MSWVGEGGCGCEYVGVYFFPLSGLGVVGGKRLMVVCVDGRVKLANDVTYKRYIYNAMGRERESKGK